MRRARIEVACRPTLFSYPQSQPFQAGRLLPRLLFIFLPLLILASCSKSTVPSTEGVAKQASATPVVTSVSVVRVATVPVELSVGRPAEAAVNITVQNGYHINANPATFPYLKPTEVEIKAPAGIKVGFITYPNSTLKKFPFADQPIAIYEGNTRVKVHLTAAPPAVKGQSNLAGTVKVQACDDQVCYAPGAIEISVPVTIK